MSATTEWPIACRSDCLNCNLKGSSNWHRDVAGGPAGRQPGLTSSAGAPQEENNLLSNNLCCETATPRRMSNPPANVVSVTVSSRISRPEATDITGSRYKNPPVDTLDKRAAA